MSNDDDKRKNWKNSEVLHRESNGRNDYSCNYESGHRRNQGSKAGMDLIRMIEDLMIEDTSLGIEFNMKILVEVTAEIGVRVEILGEQAGLTLNKEKCKSCCGKLKYLGLVISKDRVTAYERKLRAIVEMRPPENSNQKLGMVSDGKDFLVGDIEKWFDEARKNTKAKHENWAKYYDRRRREVKIKKKIQERDETVMPNTSGYNLRLRRGTKVESRPSSEKRIQQGRPIRSRGNREQQYSPCAEEQRRSDERSTRSR
ncbi:hypothetical protein TNCV_4729371 [Trichonephila clavipes]|nr:hypothetical protein TNCV_4729371 [Trichonephila clavipes]